MLFLKLTVGGERACQTLLVMSAPELSVGVERVRQGRRRVLNGACRVVPGIILRGRGSPSDVTGCVGPSIIRRGRRSVFNVVCRFGPGIIRRGQESESAVSGCKRARHPCLVALE